MLARSLGEQVVLNAKTPERSTRVPAPRARLCLAAAPRPAAQPSEISPSETPRERISLRSEPPSSLRGEGREREAAQFCRQHGAEPFCARLSLFCAELSLEEAARSRSGSRSEAGGAGAVPGCQHRRLPCSGESCLLPSTSRIPGAPWRDPPISLSSILMVKRRRGCRCSTSGAELALVCVIVIMGAAEEISSLEGCQAHSQRAALQIYYYFLLLFMTQMMLLPQGC